MRRIWLLIGCAGIAAGAVISGVVVDTEGKPIEGARIDHYGPLVAVSPTRFNVKPGPAEVRSAADGHFDVSTTKQAIVIRKPGFESQRILIKSDAEIRVVLKPIGPAPACEVKLPPIHTKAVNDVDYTSSWRYIETADGPKGIIIGQGPLYSFGAPSDSDVWNSTEYSEIMFPDGVVDARGHTADGNYWRSQTIFGAAAGYNRMDQATAKMLDCIMDGMKKR